MLTSISPLGERARHNRWSVTAGAYLAGSTIAATGIGALLGAAGSLFPVPAAARAAVVALVAVAALLADTGVLALPTLRRQVNEDWLNRYRGWVYGVGFGAQLGTGVATVVASGTVYLILAGELMVGSTVAGALIGATFGVVRAGPLLVVGRAVRFDQLVAQHRRVVALAPTGRRATLIVTAASAAILTAVTIGSLA